jgi:very-short-patch-repair endonuclease
MDIGDLGGMGGGGGGEPPISAPGGMGDMGGGDAGSPMEKSRSITAENVNPEDFGGKILKKKTRDRIQHDQQKVFRKQETHGVFHDQQGQTRDEKGRIMFTKAERDLIPKIRQLQEQGLLNDPVYPQYRVQIGSQEYSLDFGIPTLKIGIEADGEIFHSSPEQVQRDNARDAKLQQQGWTILRFTDTEIETKGQQITNTILKETMRKRMWMEQNKPQDTNLNNPDGQ